MNDYISRDDVLKAIDYQHEVNNVFESEAAYVQMWETINDDRGIKAANVQPIIETENMAIASDEFICKKCGIYLKDYIKVVMNEDNNGCIDEQHYEYEPKFCPECGAKVESCIKIPKRDKPLYTMDEICKMNGVDFNPR